jgi:hypothetical protein
MYSMMKASVTWSQPRCAYAFELFIVYTVRMRARTRVSVRVRMQEGRVCGRE